MTDTVFQINQEVFHFDACACLKWSQSVTLRLFGNVVAGEVHPQPHISVFGKAKKSDFAW
jgi:hypothetical protein